MICRTLLAALVLFAIVAMVAVRGSAWWAPADSQVSIPEGVKNSQKPEDAPPTPAESLAKITVPEGFHVTLCAGEPAVAQPIALAIDHRGRVWVAECYSYREWNETGKDRILIFEDSDGDGVFDSRKVFQDNLPNLTGVEIGHGGVWACCAPNLLFIPDADRDDRPDGPPVVKLDGWNVKEVGHNIYNGLAWGPDGWLYGMQGIKGESRVAKPGTPLEERPRQNCSVWRYHPVSERYEVVAHGTTNPWGLDWNDHGEGFFINCVIGHLWHLIPGAHYKRMYGQDYNKHAYELIDAHSDHLHWGGGAWQSSRGGEGVHSEAGGGHAHTGLMIYLGDNWPAAYRNGVFTCNIHGYRMNHDLLKRVGSGYVGQHGKDLFFANDPWFRGIDLAYGPDGGVYISDWTDFGECHDNDGVHRSSGRIYKLVYGKPNAPAGLDIGQQTDEQLVELQLHANDWYVRHARQALAERAAAGKDLAAANALLLKMYRDQADETRRLRAMWALHATGAATGDWLVSQLSDSNEYVRGWAVQLLMDGHQPAPPALALLEKMAATDTSPYVRLKLASALQRLPVEQRWGIAGGLAQRAEDDKDHNLPLLIWYGIEPSVAADSRQAIALAGKAKLSQLRQFIVRRLAEK